MDRSCASEPEHSTAMRTAGSAAFELLLSAAAGERSKSGSAPPTRSVVFEAPLLRQPQNGCRTGSEPQAHPAPDAYPGHRSPLSQTKFKSPGAGASSLSVPAARRGNPPAQPRLEHRYYLPSDAWRLSLSSGGDGLVQPLRAQLGTLQHSGEQFLPGCARGRLSLRSTRNLELRSVLAIHLRRISFYTPGAWHPDQYGWPWSSSRQRFYRTAVALAQVRTDLPATSPAASICSRPCKAISTFTTINARIRRWAIRPRPIYSHTDPKGRGHFPDEGSALKIPGFNAVISRMVFL